MASEASCAGAGRRIIVVGSTCSGKTTLAERLAARLGVPATDLDALHWEPHWTEADRAVFRERVRQAVATPGWVIGGNYLTWQQDISWPLADTVVWLDFELPIILRRIISRSWRRYRSRELLWGTNYEDFWTHLKLWEREKSLISWAVTTHRAQRRRYAVFLADPRWAHIRFVRLRRPEEVERWLAAQAR
jgi:adenylate kinase family enzyme